MSSQLYGGSRTLRTKKARTPEELAVRFDVSFDRSKREIILAWKCTQDFKKEVSRKLRARCKDVLTAYRCSEGIVVKLHDRCSRSIEDMAKAVLYEARRIVNGERPAIFEPRQSRPSRNKGYTNQGRKKGRRPHHIPAITGA